MATTTLTVRLRDKHANLFVMQAMAVNFVWNYRNKISSRSIRERGHFLSAFDLHAYTTGAFKEPGLYSQTVQFIAAEYLIRRKLFSRKHVWHGASSPVRPARRAGCRSIRAHPSGSMARSISTARTRFGIATSMWRAPHRHKAC